MLIQGVPPYILIEIPRCSMAIRITSGSFDCALPSLRRSGLLDLMTTTAPPEPEYTLVVQRPRSSGTKGADMKIIGCDYHPSFQQIAMLDTETGEVTERRLYHGNGEAQRFYESLSGPVLVGVESSGNMLWFERLLTRLKQELWIGDAAAIHWQNPRKQQLTDKRDAQHL